MPKGNRLNGGGKTVRSSVDVGGQRSASAEQHVGIDAVTETLGADLSSMLAQAVESSPDMIGVANVTGEFTFVNDSFLRMSGWRRDELMGLHFGVVLSPNNAAAVVQGIGTLGLVEGGWSGDCLLRRKDESDFDVFLNVGPIKDNAGRVTGMFGIARDISEKKKAEELLRRSEEKFRELAEHIRVVFFITTAAPFAINYVSPAYEQILGRPPDLLYADPSKWVETIYPEDRERVIGVLAQSQQGIETKTEYRIVRPDGGIRWLSTNTYPVHDSQGKLLRMVGIIEDVTEQRAKDDALRKSEEQFRQLADSISEIFFILTPDPPRTAYISPAYETITGRPCQEAYDNVLAWLDCVHPEDRERVGQGFAHIMQGNRSNMAYRILRPDGGIRWIESRSFPIYDSEGKLIRIVGIAENVTERREKAEALRASEEQFRQLADNIHELFFVISPEPFQVTYLSPAYDQIWGRSRQEVYDRPMAWVESIHPEDRGVIASIFEQQRVQDATAFRIVRPNGDIRWIAVRSFPVFDQSGKLVRAVGVAEDVTIRREKEEALVEAHAKLRAAVAKLEEQNEEGAKLSELVDILQSCESIDEAYKIAENGLQGMLRSSAGALCMTSPSRDVVEVVAGWGESL
jgi:PAS domain S-box-containing protein